MVWQWWVAFNLHKRFVPGSVTIAKTFLVVSPLVAGVGVTVVAWSTIRFNAGAAAVEIFLRAAISNLVWFLYFTWSRRVKNTYSLDFRASTAATAEGSNGRADPTFKE